MRALTRSRDARAGLVATILGVIYLVAALQIDPDPSAASVLGPRVAPLLIGAVTVACAVALVVQGLRSSEVTTAAEELRDIGDDSDGAGRAAVPDEDSDPRSRWQVVVSFVMFAAYIVAFIPLGYLLSTFAFLVAITTYVDRSKLVRNAIFAAVFAPVVYLLFNYGLRVQLPPGLLG